MDRGGALGTELLERDALAGLAPLRLLDHLRRFGLGLRGALRGDQHGDGLDACALVALGLVLLGLDAEGLAALGLQPLRFVSLRAFGLEASLFGCHECVARGLGLSRRALAPVVGGLRVAQGLSLALSLGGDRRVGLGHDHGRVGGGAEGDALLGGDGPGGLGRRERVAAAPHRGGGAGAGRAGDVDEVRGTAGGVQAVADTAEETVFEVAGGGHLGVLRGVWDGVIGDLVGVSDASG